MHSRFITHPAQALSPEFQQNESLTLGVLGDTLGYVKFLEKSTVIPESVQQRFDAEKTVSGTASQERPPQMS
jgi:hypothetical protein